MQRNKYNMHHQWIASNQIGHLTPMFIQEVTPGDTWSGRSTGVFRMAPLDLPTYMSLSIFVHYFFVPHRLVWDEFEEVVTGSDTTTPWPTLPSNVGTSTNWEKFGVQSHIVNNSLQLNALPVRAYNKIYNDHFRNNSTTVESSLNNMSTHRVNFPSSDYFGGITSEIQQGSVETIDSSGSTIPVTEIRDAFNRQRFKERRSQYGERFRDYLLSDFNVQCPDSRLDRSEHCASGKTTMGISEVVTTATSTEAETGSYRGHGITGLTVNFKKRYFPEHGTLMGVCYCRPRLQIKRTVPKHWLIGSKEDLYVPSLSSDTQVTVSSLEVDASKAPFNYGYLPKDQWLRAPRDIIAGDMLGSHNDAWTATISNFAGTPPLAFMQQVQEYDELFQDQSSIRSDIYQFFDHKISKKSVIKRRPKS